MPAVCATVMILPRLHPNISLAIEQRADEKCTHSHTHTHTHKTRTTRTHNMHTHTTLQNGGNEHEVFSFLKNQPGCSGQIMWNFRTKFLVSS
jgi:glutathione peroxidase-family protein